MTKRILIVGDSGMGKSTMAEELSKISSIPFYSTDDFYWKTKFTEINDKQKSIDDLGKIYDKNEWIVEGGTRHLTQRGIEDAGTIYFLKFNNILLQYYFIVRRSFGRKNERFIDLWKLLKHITYKRYKKGYGNHLPSLEEMLKPYENKVVRLKSRKEIQKCLNSASF
jgi:adenylate kinase family enzyme